MKFIEELKQSLNVGIRYPIPSDISSEELKETDDESQTVLHLAMAHDYSNSTIERLIKAGANVFAKDNNGMTPLNYALAANNFDVLKIVCAKYNIDPEEFYARYMLFAFFGGEKVEKVLRYSAAELKDFDYSGGTSKHILKKIAEYLSDFIKLNKLDHDQFVPLLNMLNEDYRSGLQDGSLQLIETGYKSHFKAAVIEIKKSESELTIYDRADRQHPIRRLNIGVKSSAISFELKNAKNKDKKTSDQILDNKIENMVNNKYIVDRSNYLYQKKFKRGICFIANTKPVVLDFFVNKRKVKKTFSFFSSDNNKEVVAHQLYKQFTLYTRIRSLTEYKEVSRRCALEDTERQKIVDRCEDIIKFKADILPLLEKKATGITREGLTYLENAPKEFQLKLAACDGNEHSMIKLALYHRDGGAVTIQKDEKEFTRILEDLSRMKDPLYINEANFLLAISYFYGLGCVSCNKEKAVMYLKKIESNNPDASSYICGLLSYKDQIERLTQDFLNEDKIDPTTIEYWLVHAAVQFKSFKAANSLYKEFLSGNKLPLDLSKSEKYRVLCLNNCDTELPSYSYQINPF